jgi:hypothetical protein
MEFLEAGDVEYGWKGRGEVIPQNAIKSEPILRNDYEKNIERKNDYFLAKEQGKIPAQSNPASPTFDLESILLIHLFDIKEGHCFC